MIRQHYLQRQPSKQGPFQPTAGLATIFCDIFEKQALLTAQHDLSRR
jgi:hypothetical protein